MVELTRRIFALHDITVIPGFYPGTQALEQQGLKRSSQPLIELSFHFWHLSDTPFDWASLEDLTPYTMGTINGYYYGPKLGQLIKNRTLRSYEVKDNKANVYRLFKQRIDFFGDDLFSPSLSPSVASSNSNSA
jgi:hypothetical protein